MWRTGAGKRLPSISYFSLACGAVLNNRYNINSGLEPNFTRSLGDAFTYLYASINLLCF